MTNGEKFKETFGFGADGSRVIAVNATWWDCEFQNRKPITKADCIRSMLDEELADFLYATWKEQDAFSKEACEKCGDTDVGCSPKCWLKWLKQETTGNDYENGVIPNSELVLDPKIADVDKAQRRLEIPKKTDCINYIPPTGKDCELCRIRKDWCVPCETCEQYESFASWLDRKQKKYPPKEDE